MDNDWVTLASVGTFAGATSATTVVSNGIQKAFDFNPRWLGLLIAEVLCVGLVFTVPYEGSTSLGGRIVLAVINGFFVFAAASGATSIGNSLTPGAERKDAQGHAEGLRPTRRFWSPWP